MEQAKMPLIDGAASHIARDIERFAVSCPSSQGEVWHATTDLKDSGYAVRAWTGDEIGNHKCWINFDVMQTGVNSSVVSIGMCSSVHHSTRVKDYVVNAIRQHFG